MIINSPTVYYPLVDLPNIREKGVYRVIKRSVVRDNGLVTPGRRLYCGVTHRGFVRGKEHWYSGNKVRGIAGSLLGRRTNVNRKLEFDVGRTSRPERFFMGFYTIEDGSEFAEENEKAVIEWEAGRGNPLYNKVNGGNGGTTRKNFLRRAERMGEIYTQALPVRLLPARGENDIREPGRWYRCRVKDQTVVVSLPEKLVRSRAFVIYVWRNMANGKELIGYTGQRELGGRFTNYFKDTSNPELLNDLRDHPEQFAFSIIEQIPEGTDPGDREKLYIDARGSKTNGYNRRRGGGGSRPFIKPVVAEDVSFGRSLVDITVCSREIFLNMRRSARIREAHQ